MRQVRRNSLVSRRMSEQTTANRRRRYIRAAARASLTSTCNHSATMMGDVANAEPFLSVRAPQNPVSHSSESSTTSRPSVDTSNNASRVLRSRRLSGPVTRSLSRATRCSSRRSEPVTRKRGRPRSVSRSRSRSLPKRTKRRCATKSSSQPGQSSSQNVSTQDTAQSDQEAKSPTGESNQQPQEQAISTEDTSQNQCCSVISDVSTSQNNEAVLETYPSWSHIPTAYLNEAESSSVNRRDIAYSLPSADLYDVEDSQDSDEQETDEVAYDQNQNAAVHEQELIHVSETEIPQDLADVSEERFSSSFSTREDSIS